MNNSSTITAKRTNLLNAIKTGAKAKGVTQEQLAESADARVTSVNRMLQGKFSPRLDTVISLANAAGYEIVLIEKA